MLLRIAWWAGNIYFAKRGFDAMKENVLLKETLKDTEATVRVLAGQVKDPLPPIPEEVQVEEIFVHLD